MKGNVISHIVHFSLPDNRPLSAGVGTCQKLQGGNKNTPGLNYLIMLKST